MKPALERLSELAVDADRAHSYVTHALDQFFLKKPDAIKQAKYALSVAQGKLNHINRQLVLLGGEDNRRKRTRMLLAEREQRGLPLIQDNGDVPLHLLSSEKSRKAAEALRAAADAVAAMEQERGIEDGIAERLGDYADWQEMEVFGPKWLED